MYFHTSLSESWTVSESNDNFPFGNQRSNHNQRSRGKTVSRDTWSQLKQFKVNAFKDHVDSRGGIKLTAEQRNSSYLSYASTWTQSQTRKLSLLITPYSLMISQHRNNSLWNHIPPKHGMSYVTCYVKKHWDTVKHYCFKSSGPKCHPCGYKMDLFVFRMCVCVCLCVCVSVRLYLCRCVLDISVSVV